MSLIGPRPDPLDDMDIYTEHQKRKLEVNIMARQQILHPARIRVFHRAVPAVEWTGGNPPFPDVRSGHG